MDLAAHGRDPQPAKTVGGVDLICQGGKRKGPGQPNHGIPPWRFPEKSWGKPPVKCLFEEIMMFLFRGLFRDYQDVFMLNRSYSGVE